MQEATLTTKTDLSEPTQQLLAALGRFQRELTAAEAGDAGELWSDECMNQLIGAVEVSLREGWTEIVEALADTGRVLQSYENASRSHDAVPFLHDAYELLCLMVGDVIVDGVRPGVLEKWTRLYNRALGEMKAAGVPLASDTDDPGAGSVADDTDLPFEMPPLTRNRDDALSDDDLPTLDALPPLESMLELGVSPVKKAPSQSIVPDLADVVETEDLELLQGLTRRGVEALDEEEIPRAATPSADAEELEDIKIDPKPGGAQPSRLVVDVMDRICDELGELETAVGERRNEALRTIEGGLVTLKREAREHGYDVSEALAQSMIDVCKQAIADPEIVNERFTDLAFAFCGVYVEALEGGTENVEQWRSERKAMIAEWNTRETRSAAPEAPAEAIEKSEGEVIGDAVPETAEADALYEPFEPLVASAKPIETPKPEPAPEPVAPTPEPAQAAASSRPRGASLSNELLAQAQEAALRGDTQAAQQLALRAAAEIAAQGVAAAHAALRDAETRLRGCIDSTEHAREMVRKRESELATADARVAQCQKALESAQEENHASRVEVENVQTRVDTLTAQIQELQARREKELDELKNSQAMLRQHELALEERRREVTGSESGVVKARETLEFARQDVKAKQRAASEIEAEIARARVAMQEKETSLESIRTTLGQPAGGPTTASESQEDMLF